MPLERERLQQSGHQRHIDCADHHRERHFIEANTGGSDPGQQQQRRSGRKGHVQTTGEQDQVVRAIWIGKVQAAAHKRVGKLVEIGEFLVVKVATEECGQPIQQQGCQENDEC